MKKQALQELRRLYKEVIRDKTSLVGLHRKTRYNAVREFCLNIDILTFQEIETMETEQDDILAAGKQTVKI